MTRGTKVKLNIYAFVTVFFWAAAFPLTKLITSEISPYSLGLFRCIVASICLMVMGKFIGIRRPFRKADTLLFALCGICGFALYLIFFNTGIQTVTSATSSVIIASTPILTAILCSIFYKERISPVGWISIFMSFAGVAILLFFNGVFSINRGIVWTIFAALVFCIYNVLSRRLINLGYSSIEIVTFGMISGAIFMFLLRPSAIMEIAEVKPAYIGIAVLLGMFPSGASYVLWAKAMELAEKTSEVTNYMFITPLLSTIMGFVLLSEIPDGGTIIGGLIIIFGVVLFGLRGRR